MAGFNHFHRIADGLDSGVEGVLDAFAARALAGAQQRAAVDTGHMRGSGQLVTPGKGERRIQFGADYSIHQEYGTIHQAGTPFVRPAIEEIRSPLIDAIGKVMRP